MCPDEQKATFAEVTDVTGLGPAFAVGKFDGIMGMAFQTISVDNVPTIFSLMVQDKLVDQPVFAFYLPSTSGAQGELILGGIDKAHYTGSLDYVPLTSETCTGCRLLSLVVVVTHSRAAPVVRSFLCWLRDR